MGVLLLLLLVTSTLLLVTARALLIVLAMLPSSALLGRLRVSPERPGLDCKERPGLGLRGTRLELPMLEWAEVRLGLATLLGGTGRADKLLITMGM